MDTQSKVIRYRAAKANVQQLLALAEPILTAHLNYSGS